MQQVAYLEADERRNMRKMWGFPSWKIFGKAWGTGFKIWIFPQFSHDEQVSKFGFFRSFLQFLRGGRAHPKISKLQFSAVSWEFEGRDHPKKIKTWTYPQFSWDFEGTNPPKKLANLRTYPQFSWKFEVTDPPKNLANPRISLDRKPGNHEVWKALTNSFSSLPLHLLETSAF